MSKKYNLPFFCNDCQSKFRAKPLEGRNTRSVQHFCALYRKIVTRKVGYHSTRCKASHGNTPCITTRLSSTDSDYEDQAKANYHKLKNQGKAILYNKKRQNDNLSNYEPPTKKYKISTLQNIYNNQTYGNNINKFNDLQYFKPLKYTKNNTKSIKFKHKSSFFGKTPLVSRKQRISNNNIPPDINDNTLLPPIIDDIDIEIKPAVIMVPPPLINDDISVDELENNLLELDKNVKKLKINKKWDEIVNVIGSEIVNNDEFSDYVKWGDNEILIGLMLIYGECLVKNGDIKKSEFVWEKLLNKFVISDDVRKKVNELKMIKNE